MISKTITLTICRAMTIDVSDLVEAAMIAAASTQISAAEAAELASAKDYRLM